MDSAVCPKKVPMRMAPVLLSASGSDAANRCFSVEATCIGVPGLRISVSALLVPTLCAQGESLCQKTGAGLC